MKTTKTTQNTQTGERWHVNDERMICIQDKPPKDIGTRRK
jgi:hypothetical protein